MTIQFKSQPSWKSEDLVKYLPPSYRIFRDPLNGRYRAWQHKTRWSVSRSWGLAGSEEAAIRGCLSATWARYTSLTGEACAVEGL